MRVTCGILSRILDAKHELLCFIMAFYCMIHPMIRVRSTPFFNPLSLARKYLIGILVAEVLVNPLDYGLKCCQAHAIGSTVLRFCQML